MKKRLFMMFLLAALASVLSAQQSLQEEQDFRFAIQLENKELFDIAALQFERFAETYPKSAQAPTALFRAGENYNKADSLAKASTAYMAVLLKYPDSPVMDKAQFNQGTLLAKNNEHRKAAIAFDRVKILVPKSALIPDAQVAAAQSWLSAGEYQKAYDAAFYILENHKIHPTRLQAYKTIAEVHEKKGDYMQALNVLDRILGDRVADEFAADVYTKKAQLLKKLGRYTQADSVLGKLLDGKYGSPIVAGAAQDLAVSMQAQRQFKEADKVLNNALGKVDPRDKTQLWQTLGDNFYLQEDYSQAKQTYLYITDYSETSIGLYFYRLGMVNKQLGDVRSALTQFEQVLNDTLLSDDVQFYAAIEYANLLSADAPVEGIRFLQGKVAKTKSLVRRNELFFAIAKLQENYLDYTGARQNYNAVIAGSPKSSILDDAQFYAARSYENEDNLKSALTEYNRYLQYYPGGDFYQTSQEKVNLLSLIASDPKSLDDALNEILLQGLTADSRAEALNSLAQYQIYSFHDYEKALDLLARAEKEDASERLNKEKLDYDRAFCHFVLHEKATLKKRPGNAHGHAQKLVNLAERMGMNYSSSTKTAQVEFWAAQTNLPNFESSSARVDFLNSFITKMDNDSLKQHLQLQLVDEMVAAQAESGGDYRQASLVLSGIIANNVSEKIHADALYKQALLLHKMSFADSALGLLNQMPVIHNAPRRVDGLYLRAAISEEQESYADALRLYYDVTEKYFYSPWADRAQVKLISLMLKQGQYKEANDRMAAAEQTGVPRELKIFYPSKVDDETLWLWAELTRRTKSPQKAVVVYQKYLDLGRDTKHRVDALFAIGELADTMNKQEMALGYFEECANSFPNDSLGQIARVRTAQLYFDRGMYEPAKNLYADMRKELSGGLQKDAFQQQVICDYRLGRLSQANALAKQYKKEYNDRNGQARFLYEEGMHYIKTKNLSKAEKTLKSLAGKYDDVPEGARGDLGLARLYVVQNKTEEALKRLTAIPQKYDDPEIVATAYLNLSDFYYENRALENTIHAGRQVLELQKSGPLRAQALDLLIGAYDDLGMRDQAIAYQREYIDLYPFADNILDRRIKIGTFLFYLKEYDRAIVQLKEVMPLVSANDEGRVQFWIAEAYAGGGFTEQAIIEYLKVRYQCKQHPKLPFGVTAVYKAGEGYQKLGNLLKAKEMFEIVVRERGATDDFGRAANKKIGAINAQLDENS